MSDDTVDRLGAVRACSAWINENGGDMALFMDGSLEFRESQHGGIGSFAKRAIQPVERLLFVPPSCRSDCDNFICKRPFLNRIAGDVFEQCQALCKAEVELKGLPPAFCEHNVRMIVLVFLLLVCFSAEKPKSRESAMDSSGLFNAPETRELKSAVNTYRSYMATLPKSLEGSVFSWTTCELDHLNETPLLLSLLKLRQDVDDIWTKIVQPLLEDTSVAATVLRNLLPCSADACVRMFHAAVALTTSRHHGSQESLVMLPVMDLINGVADGSAECNSTLVLNGLFATCATQEGTEIISECGELENVKFICKCGFCPSVNVHNSIQVWIPEKHMLNKGDERWVVLQAVNISESVVRSGAGLNYPFTLPAELVHKHRRNCPGVKKPSGLGWLEGCVALVCAKPCDTSPSDEKKRIHFIIDELLDARLEELACTRNNLGTALRENPSPNLLVAQKHLDNECSLMLQWRRALSMRHKPNDANPRHLALLRDVDHCAACHGILNLRRCAKCKDVKHCSVPCQKEDWKLGHKTACCN